MKNNFTKSKAMLLAAACLGAVISVKAQDTLKISSVQKVSDKSGGLGNVLASNEGFGSRVSNIGDLNADGVSDLAVTAAGDDDGGTDNGALFILFMNQDGTVKSHQKISETSGNPGITFPSSSLLFGYSVTSMGDLDGDGIQDLAVGMITGNDSYTGAVAILFMKRDGTVKSSQLIDRHNSLLSSYLTGGNFFGCDVHNIGDINGDGVADLGVGAQSEENNKGALYILFMKTDGTVKSVKRIGNNAGGLSTALTNGDNFGVSVEGIGDVNGDHINDIAIGAFGDNTRTTGAGCVYIANMNMDGSIKSASKIYLDDNKDAYFGMSICSVKDLNGDGIRDLLVGANYDNDGGTTSMGAVYVIYLDAKAGVKSSHKISASTANFTGYLSAGAKFGNGVTYLDDYDKHNYTIVAGSPGDNDGSSGAGALYEIRLAHTVTSIDESASETSAAIVYPNPFSQSISIKTSFKSNNQVVAKIYDIEGREVADISAEIRKAVSNAANVDLSALNKGIYLLKISNGSESTVSKLIKSN